MGVSDFFFGSPGSQSTYYPPPIYPPGWGFANSFFNNIMPGLINMQPPQYPGQLDPGMSPSAAAALRMAQNQSMSPVPDMMGPLYGFMGAQGGANAFQPQRGWGQAALANFAGVNQPSPSASGWSGPAPNFGFGPGAPSYQNPFASRLPINMTPGPGGAWQAQPQGGGGLPAMMAAFGAAGGGGGGPMSGGMGRVTGNLAPPFPIEDPTQRDPRAPGSDQPSNQDPMQPVGPHPQRPSPGIDPTGGGGGGIGSGPSSPSSPSPTTPTTPATPGTPAAPGGGLGGMWSSMPKWLQDMLIASGLNLVAGGGGGGGGGGGAFGGPYGQPAPVNLPAYQGPPTRPGVTHQPRFVDWNPGSDAIQMQRGLGAGSSTTLPGIGGAPGGGPTTAPAPSNPGQSPPPGGGAPGGGMPYDPNGVVPGNQLTWFGRNHGINKGKPLAEVHRDMYERGWDFGPNFQKPPEWGERGSRQTTWQEVMSMPASRRAPGSPGFAGGAPPGSSPSTPAFSPPAGAGGPSGGGPRSVTSASQAGQSNPFALLQAFRQGGGSMPGARQPFAPMGSVSGQAATPFPVTPGGADPRRPGVDPNSANGPRRLLPPSSPGMGGGFSGGQFGFGGGFSGGPTGISGNAATPFPVTPGGADPRRPGQDPNGANGPRRMAPPTGFAGGWDGSAGGFSGGPRRSGGSSSTVGPGAGQMVGDFMQRFNPQGGAGRWSNAAGPGAGQMIGDSMPQLGGMQGASPRPSFPIGGGQGPQSSPGPPMTPAPPMSVAPGGPQQPPAMPDFFGAGLNAARDAYLSQVPVMQADMKSSIGDAMATAGFGGNRFSSSAMKSAADVGANAGLRQNALMGQLLGDATERGLDRALQSTGMSMDDNYRYNQMGWQGNENAQDRQLRAIGMQPDFWRTQQDLQRQPMLDLFNMGQWEQGRQDMFNLLPFQDWQNNRYGLLPDIMGMVGGVGGPSLQQPTQTSTPGGTGAIDWFNLINAFRGAYGGGQG